MIVSDSDAPTVPPPPPSSSSPDLYERARRAATPEARAAARAAEAPTDREIARRRREDAIPTVRPPAIGREPRMTELYLAVFVGD